MKCTICEIHCRIETGAVGRCGMMTSDGTNIQERYPDRYLAAVETAIESMPMVHYHPRAQFLQVCTVGCNFTCRGCVSGVLTDHLTAIQGAFQTMTPEGIVDKAKSLGCLGVMFCFNEPTVSYFTFRRLAEMAKSQGLRVGCSTNGYMTESALADLIPFLDFVNLGLKGASDQTYRACGVPSMAPVLRNLSLLVERGVYVEVSAIFRRHGEAELLQAADQVAALSADIPFQVMRFIPFGDAPEAMEPSVREAEAVCTRLRRILRHVYLFNTPGTDALNSRCPECGETIMRRGFFGPMCANLFDYRPGARCRCGYQVPIIGEIHDTPAIESGYFGGYRTINALSMIRALLEVIGVTEKERTDAVISDVLSTDFIKSLHQRLNRIEAYFDTVDEFAAMTGQQYRAKAFRRYVGNRVSDIQARVHGLPKPPVYCTLGHPRIAMFVDKMESCLIETAGGDLINHRIEREPRPGIPISTAQFNRLGAQIIIVPSAAAWPADDVIAYCAENGLHAPALDTGRVLHLSPYRAATNPDWVLGLMHLANIIHPEIFDFDLPREADAFYQEFYHCAFDPDGRRTPGRAKPRPIHASV